MRILSIVVGLILILGIVPQLSAAKIADKTVVKQATAIEVRATESDSVSDTNSDIDDDDDSTADDQTSVSSDETTKTAEKPSVNTADSNPTDKKSSAEEKSAAVAVSTKGTNESSDEASDESDEKVTQEDIQGLRSDIETLRDQWNRALTRNSAQSTRNLLVGGFFQTRYTKSWAESSPSSFDIPLFVVSFSGNLKKDYEQGKNLNYYVSLSSNTGDSYRFKPLDAYISYSFLPSVDATSPQLNFIFGQQKKQFGLEPLSTEDNQPAIRAALFANNLGLSTRDIGATIKGDWQPTIDYGTNYRVPVLEYALGVFNGSGQNTVDTDKYKDLVGRIAFNAPSTYNSLLRGLSAGYSFYKGDKTLTIAGVGKAGVKNRDDFFISYVRSPLGVTAEYAKGEDDNVVSNAKSNVHAKGHTITFFYSYGDQFVKGFRNQTRYDDWWPRTVQPFVRFDWYDPNTSVNNDDQKITTIGLNWFFAQTTKFQINYNIKKETPNLNNDELIAQYQFGF